MTVALDPALTVLMNMERLFAQAAKGQRGLAAIAARRRTLREGGEASDGKRTGFHSDKMVPIPSRQERAGKGVAAHVYRTSDGFLVLRGKNRQANDALLRLASPFDLWLHAAGGPGAHLILRRDHPGQEVPQRSLLEAAGLAALASFASGAAKAEVLLAPVSAVRRIKGAELGQVRLAAGMATLVAVPDPELEKLKANP